MLFDLDNQYMNKDIGEAEFDNEKENLSVT